MLLSGGPSRQNLTRRAFFFGFEDAAGAAGLLRFARGAPSSPPPHPAPRAAQLNHTAANVTSHPCASADDGPCAQCPAICTAVASALDSIVTQQAGDGDAGLYIGLRLQGLIGMYLFCLGVTLSLQRAPCS